MICVEGGAYLQAFIGLSYAVMNTFMLAHSQRVAERFRVSDCYLQHVCGFHAVVCYCICNTNLVPKSALALLFAVCNIVIL